MVLKVAVIGGGASGLVTLKYLVEAHKFFPGVEIEARLFEAHAEIGGVFRYQVYENAEVRDGPNPAFLVWGLRFRACDRPIKLT